MGDATHAAGQADAVVGNSTYTARQEVVNDAYTISEVGTQFSSVRPTSHDVSDSPPLTGDAEREPSPSPDKNASASLDESATGDASTGFSSVALSLVPSK